jgi:hypothetical protein
VKILQEITDWDTPNHVYFTNDSKDKIYAYVKASGGEVQRFKVPMKFKTSGRKFKEVPNTWGYSVDDKPAGRTWAVAGSRGDSYTVSENNNEWQCTCAGFKFRGACKHVSELQAVQSSIGIVVL